MVPEPAAQREQPAAPVLALVTFVAGVASVAFVFAAPSIADTVRSHPLALVEFLALTLALQLFGVPVTGGGHVSVGAIGKLAAGIALGPGAAMLIGAAAGLLQWGRTRGPAHRGVFDAAQFALASGAAAVVYETATHGSSSNTVRFAAALAAGIVYTAVNNALLCSAIGLDGGRSPLEVWRERFEWARFHYPTFGPLALAACLGRETLGLAGLLAFTVPAGLLLLSVRRHLELTTASLERERTEKERYRTQSDDMRALFELAGGFSSRSHDRGSLVAFAQQRLAQLVGASAAVIDGPAAAGVPLETGGRVAARLRFTEGPEFDAERWDRLRDVIAPQLATAVTSAELVEHVWRTHLETIAALSRSIDAKEHFAGGHAERVATLSVALARRLGYAGLDLDAVEVAALLHDVGKIAIPERILNKPGALDVHEWSLMMEHPVLADRILEPIDLPPIIRQVARSSHERIDGAGYPDGLAGDGIPLPARIVLVADAYDAMTSDRPYRRARGAAEALQEIYASAGTQFCRRVVAALEQVRREEPQILGSMPYPVKVA